MNIDNDPAFPIDLGCDHYLRYASWTPNRELYKHYDDKPDTERFAAVIRHKRVNKKGSYYSGKWCQMTIVIDGPVQRDILPRGPKWRVESWEPLTIENIIECRCGDSGYIRGGKWMSEKVKVRIFVAVDPRGMWAASGWSREDGTVDDEAVMDMALDLIDPGEARYWVEAELPLPSVPVVEGEVKAAGGWVKKENEEDEK